MLYYVAFHVYESHHRSVFVVSYERLCSIMPIVYFQNC